MCTYCRSIVSTTKAGYYCLTHQRWLRDCPAAERGPAGCWWSVHWLWFAGQGESWGPSVSWIVSSRASWSLRGWSQWEAGDWRPTGSGAYREQWMMRNWLQFSWRRPYQRQTGFSGGPAWSGVWSHNRNCCDLRLEMRGLNLCGGRLWMLTWLGPVVWMWLVWRVGAGQGDRGGRGQRSSCQLVSRRQKMHTKLN